MGKILGYLGPPGTFTEEVSIKYAGDKDLLLKSFPALDQVFSAVMRKEIEYGVVPVENSLEGSVSLTHDLLSTRVIKASCFSGGNFPGTPGSKPPYPGNLFYPQALAQCRLYLDKFYPERLRGSTAQSRGRCGVAE